MTNNKNYNEIEEINYDNYISEISHEGENWRMFGLNYLVSSFGRIYSLHRHRLLRPNMHRSKQGCGLFYQRIELHQDGKMIRIFIHRLVAMLFVPNPDNKTKTEIHHIDGNPLNNNMNNLMWVSPIEHRKLHGGKRGAAA